MRIVSVSDTHCGHEVGLTPPDWWAPPARREVRRYQRQTWRAFEEILSAIAPPVDLLFALGDLIEGPQLASRGTELGTALTMADQCEMAVEVLRRFEAREVYIVRGTPYHVGQDEDWEAMIAKELGARLATVADVTVEGVRFNLRHKVGRTSVPYGAGTPLARSYLVQAWAELRRGGEAPAVALRGHVHRFAYVGQREWLAMSLPGLGQGGGKLEQLIEGDLDWGLVSWTVSGGEYSWRAHVRPAEMRHERWVAGVPARESRSSSPS